MHTLVYAQSDTIINRYRDYLLRIDTSSELDTEIWYTTLRANGKWPDIKYDDTELSAWKIPIHLKRVQIMATQFITPQSKFYRNKELFKSINRAIDHWTAKRYQSSNWWHNEIGVPRYMRDIIILLHDQLDSTRLKKMLDVMGQLRVHDNYLAGNLIWCADLGLHYGALTNDKKLMQRCRDLITKEITISSGEGIQPDYSFQQHGRRLQMFQYGKAYIWEGLRIAWQLHGTSLSIPEEKIKLLTDVVLNGWQWMARGIYTVPGTMDRSSSRKGELKAADIRPLIPFMMELYPAKKAAIQHMCFIMNQKQILRGFRHYPYSDFMAYHRPGFSFFLKTISTRTLPTESINRENLKGKLLNSGDAYLIKNGEEYTDLMPVWNWSLLPGVTTFDGAHAIERKTFVGAVTDGESGATAMDYIMKDSTSKNKFHARKLWACFDNEVICLIGNTQNSNIPRTIYTALDQCRWKGSVITSLSKTPLMDGVHQLRNLKWVYHNGFAYIPLIPCDMSIRLETVSGSWHSINNSESTTPVIEKVFTPIIYHSTQSSAMAYVLARVASSTEAHRIARRSPWKIISNNQYVQAVQKSKGMMIAAFYSAGSIQSIHQQILQVDQPCLILLKGNKVFISDPSHQGIEVTLQMGNRIRKVSLPSDGTTVMIDTEDNF